MRRPHSFLCAVISAAGLALLLAALLVKPLNSASLLKESERQRAPDFELTDADGNPARISDYLGKVVLINFWATWCVPCKQEIPSFIGFAEAFKGQDFGVLGISMDQGGWNVVRPYMEKMGINYRIALGDARTAYKYGNVESLPVTFLVDRQRRVAAIHFGIVSKKKVEYEIRKLLEPPTD